MSLLAALVFGPLTAFVNSFAFARVRYRYEPPISETEMRQWEQGSVAHLNAELAKRYVPYTRGQWLADSIGQRLFWISLAKASLLPTFGVFFACICVRALEHRPARGATTSS